MTTPTIRVKRLRDVPLPARAHAGDAGWDLAAAEAAEIPPGGRALVSTGLAFEIPEGWEVQVRPRSGLAWRHGIGLLNAPGTIDAGYRGEVKVILWNASDRPVSIRPGDRIAQAVVARVEPARWEEVEDLTPSARGEGGFGSTGVASAAISLR